MAKQHNVDLQAVTPTGPGGNITAQDIEAFTKDHAPASDFESLRGVRRQMALTMAASHATVVPVTIFDEADIHAWPSDADITVRLIMSVIKACEKEPSLNAWFDTKTNGRKLFSEVNLGLAIDTGEDLFVPVLKNADKKSASELRRSIDKYKQGVRTREILKDELQGATITLSN